MNDKVFTVVGLGELLWDFLPGGREMGGAPANFAYIANLLGDRTVVASRLGNDDLGEEARQKLKRLGLTSEYVQADQAHPTGTVQVGVDGAGQPRFDIVEGVAWDFLEWTPEWMELAGKADSVCFGSLAQRSPISRVTIRKFLLATRAAAVRIFDVNLRQNFYSAEVLRESLKLANVAKVNHEELPRVMDLLALEYERERASAERLRTSCGLKLVCVTRGCRGSLLVGETGMHEHPGFRVKVADTVGAGDAFTAGLAHHFLRKSSLAEMNKAANRLGAWVASHAGATPMPGVGGLQTSLAAIA
jgi:fructokinase